MTFDRAALLDVTFPRETDKLAMIKAADATCLEVEYIARRRAAALKRWQEAVETLDKELQEVQSRCGHPQEHEHVGTAESGSHTECTVCGASL